MFQARVQSSVFAGVAMSQTCSKAGNYRLELDLGRRESLFRPEKVGLDQC